MTPRAQILPDGSVLLQMTKCVLIATPLELACVLFADRLLAAQAVARGKRYLRAEATARRTSGREAVQTTETKAFNDAILTSHLDRPDAGRESR